MLQSSPKLSSSTCRSGQMHSAVGCRPIAVQCNGPNAATRARLARFTTKAQQQQGVDVESAQGLQESTTIELPTIFSKNPNPNGKGIMMKANVVLPSSKGVKLIPKEGDKVRVKASGVVLFMHGFAQAPTAYARMLRQLAEKDNVVVVAPCPPPGVEKEALQDEMVESALFWRGLIASNKLPSLTLLGDTSDNVGLLGHSVGGGLAAYVVDEAARTGQQFTAAHVLAPQTGLVVPRYRFDTARQGRLLQGVSTEWGVQYGLVDLLSPFWAVNKFSDWLKAKDKLKSMTRYTLGTHVGFEDQLVVGGESFTANFLPWVLTILWGAMSLWLPLLGLRTLSKLRRSTNVPAAAARGSKGVEGSVPKNEGFGVPDDVELPDERIMLAGYVALAATVTAAEAALPGFAWDSASGVGLSILKGVFLILAIGSWPSVVIFPYSALKQRPESRREVAAFFERELVKQKIKA